MLAMFLGVPAAKLVNMKLPEKSQQQLFDEEVYRLHDEGLKYPEIRSFGKRLRRCRGLV